MASLLRLLTVLTVIIWITTLWVGTRMAAADDTALSSLDSTDTVNLEVSDLLVFRPAGRAPIAGLIFYPGGLVDPRGYAKPMREIAEAGYLVVVPSMPLNLAILNIRRADAIKLRFPEIENWLLGGHSLGGTMAVRYLYRGPETVDALILWDSYPANTDSIADQNLAVLSIYGTVPDQVTEDEIEASRARLPESIRVVAIPGGNHAQFGNFVPNDFLVQQPASISSDVQLKTVVEETLSFMDEVTRAGS